MNPINHAGIEGTSSLPAAFDIRDELGGRLRWAILLSLILNALLWRSVSGIVGHRIPLHPQPVEITRVIIDRKGRKRPKIISNKTIKKKVAQIRKKIVERKPKPHPVARKPLPRPRPTQQVARPKKSPPKPPQPEGAHHRILAQLPTKHGPPADREPTVQSGGNANVGEPIGQQNPGNAVVNPPEPIHPQPPPVVEHPAPKPAPAPPPAPVAPAPAPKPSPPPEPPPEEKPAPPPPPKPRGPTRDAEAVDTAKPDIPDELKDQEYKSFVRVRVRINPDGSATPELRTSSGNAEIDRRVLDALRRWRWKPALRDGEPVSSTQLFKFEFEVQ